jgi:hypothetical protein
MPWQANQVFEASLGYGERSCLNRTKQKKEEEEKEKDFHSISQVIKKSRNLR